MRVVLRTLVLLECKKTYSVSLPPAEFLANLASLYRRLLRAAPTASACGHNPLLHVLRSARHCSEGGYVCSPRSFRWGHCVISLQPARFSRLKDLSNRWPAFSLYSPLNSPFGPHRRKTREAPHRTLFLYLKRGYSAETVSLASYALENRSPLSHTRFLTRTPPSLGLTLLDKKTT